MSTTTVPGFSNVGSMTILRRKRWSILSIGIAAVCPMVT